MTKIYHSLNSDSMVKDLFFKHESERRSKVQTCTSVKGLTWIK